ncbi:hypothetical protein GJ744_001375 [Endocarpon pusillum]|uniref:Uncharacterized protein n=1 Tax=Endocarpon pusillum TaxID=364733 RepID=A0A8H7E8K5_9EURO|nr:hypothetical protein GJ744_001375 [Endocarpon pusillum]
MYKAPSTRKQLSRIRDSLTVSLQNDPARLLLKPATSVLHLSTDMSLQQQCILLSL